MIGQPTTERNAGVTVSFTPLEKKEMKNRHFMIPTVALIVLLGLLIWPLQRTQAAEIVVWGFDEASGTTAADSTANGNDGTLLNHTVPADWRPASGKFGGALHFDRDNNGTSTTNRVEIDPYSPTVPVGGQFTVQAWINPDTTLDAMITGAVWRSFFSMQATNNRHLMLGYWNGELRGFLDVGGVGGGSRKWVKASTTINASEWHHVAISYDGTTLRSWLDGAVMASTSVGIALDGEFDFLTVGNYFSGNPTLDGLMDEAAVSDLAATEANKEQVLGFFRGSLVPEPASLMLLGLGLIGVIGRRCRG